MRTPLVSVVASTYFLAWAPLAHSSCSANFTDQFAGAVRTANSLRPDKPGQMRVFAADGSEFSAGQVLWIKGQLRSIETDCARGDEVAAVSSLKGVNVLLNARKRD
jgi:uncharacterized protein YgbK (DUF1537 family)